MPPASARLTVATPNAVGIARAARQCSAGLNDDQLTACPPPADPQSQLRASTTRIGQ
jgi:hypothetical protein